MRPGGLETTTDRRRATAAFTRDRVIFGYRVTFRPERRHTMRATPKRKCYGTVSFALALVRMLRGLATATAPRPTSWLADYIWPDVDHQSGQEAAAGARAIVKRAQDMGLVSFGLMTKGTKTVHVWTITAKGRAYLEGHPAPATAGAAAEDQRYDSA